VKKSESKTETGLATIAQVAQLAAAGQRGRMRLFNSTDLANIPYTPANIESAVQAVNYISEQTKAILEVSVVQRGMYLCWLKSNCGEHGEWEKFCAERFPEIPERSRRRWMASYLVACGQRKPKELPSYQADEFDDEDLSGAVENLSTDKADLAPRRALLDMLAKLKKQIDKGQEQSQAKDAKIAELEKANKNFQAGLTIPESVRDEADRITTIRAKFGEFIMLWCKNLPDDREALRLHRGLWQELCEQLEDLWENAMLPHGRKLAEVHGRGETETRKRGDKSDA
jgi:hypothetical protein